MVGSSGNDHSIVVDRGDRRFGCFWRPLFSVMVLRMLRRAGWQARLVGYNLRKSRILFLEESILFLEPVAHSAFQTMVNYVPYNRWPVAILHGQTCKA